MPIYVQRSFRLKTLGLISVQLTVVFAMMLLVHALVRRNFDTASEEGQMLFYGLGAVTLFLILWLHFLKDNYPVNYILLVLTTLLVGLFWGLTPFVFGSHLHFQVIGILVIAMMVSTIAAGLLTKEKADPWRILLVSQFVGWLAGASADALVVTYLGISTAAWTTVAVAISLTLLIGVLLLDAGHLLVKCNPDDFMRVIVAMDSALLVVSMPIFVLSCCLLHASPPDLNDDGPAEAAGAPDAAAGTAGAPAAVVIVEGP